MHALAFTGGSVFLPVLTLVWLDELKGRLFSRKRIKRANQVRGPFQLDNISRQKTNVQISISAFSARERQDDLMVFFLHALPELFACPAEYPRDANRFPLDTLAAHNPTTAHCKQIATPEIIYPETENWTIRVVF
ncbi:hypothetical protein BK671_08525 [Pseudomonas fluorescens]|uniref:Uncharacterized protein n=1 Tax=Pseudomonas fluorescens TaxID=294 RepID=A0A423LMF4_PSEFL|nr:hypothetical protein BK671_08525 [Pseudomonas fluorescens]